MSDINNRKLIYLKGFLFFVILVSSAGIIILEIPEWRIVALLVLTIWASARLYYFMFYVIEKYVDPEYKFAGIYFESGPIFINDKTFQKN